ncbi:MAG: hypothetical protein ACQEQG_06190 [Bacillota bacterium]
MFVNKISSDNAGEAYKKLLLELKLEELHEIRRNWGFQGLSQMNKSALAEALAFKIPKAIPEWLQGICSQLLQPLLQLSAQKDEAYLLERKDQERLLIGYFQNLGLIFADWEEGKTIVYLPEVISTAINEALEADVNLNKTIAHNTELTRLTTGALVYYGVIDVVEILAELNQLKGFSEDKARFIQVVDNFSSSLGIIRREGKELVINMVEDKEVLKEQRLSRTDINTYQASVNELDFAGQHLYPKPEIPAQKFHDFLQYELNLSWEAIRKIFIIVYYELNNLVELEELIENISDFIGISQKETAAKLHALITNLASHTRQWSLKAHTPAELDQKFAPLTQSHGEKVVSLSVYRSYKDKTSQKY